MTSLLYLFILFTKIKKNLQNIDVDGWNKMFTVKIVQSTKNVQT
jgi:hypothetical protein